jgi:dephospho-CoA kinase
MKLRVGLTGGIGAGKSEVARIFGELGALVIDADEMARLAVAPGSEGLERIRERWPQVIAEDGTLDRPALAALTFDDAVTREALNAIVHPLVRKLAAEREAQAEPRQIVVHDVPLLFESGFCDECDANVVVIAPPDLRIQRVQARSKLSRDKIERRMAAQMDPEEARKRADYVIENEGSLEHLREQTGAVYNELRKRKRKDLSKA